MRSDLFRKGAIVSIFSLLAGSSHAAMPTAGQAAPAFASVDQDGKAITLAAFKGHPVVLYFYPKDDTPGCTKEACSFRDGYAAIQATGAVILGVSADDAKSHKAFAEKYHLPFQLVADADKKIIDAYGVRMPVLGMAKRTTFIIDKDGVIRKVFEGVSPATHEPEVLAALKGLS
ncbi:MAG TPA: peroxiredoxin [Holophagaceae bacterium]|jgi:peroxiredoxin Q/BCP|nr:peroxiredoxin [Holophagaceae bacterium]